MKSAIRLKLILKKKIIPAKAEIRENREKMDARIKQLGYDEIKTPLHADTNNENSSLRKLISLSENRTYKVCREKSA